jgi:hypothetical protein
MGLSKLKVQINLWAFIFFPEQKIRQRQHIVTSLTIPIFWKIKKIKMSACNCLTWLKNHKKLKLFELYLKVTLNNLRSNQKPQNPNTKISKVFSHTSSTSKIIYQIPSFKTIFHQPSVLKDYFQKLFWENKISITILLLSYANYNYKGNNLQKRIYIQYSCYAKSMF